MSDGYPAELEKAIGLKFRRPELLRTALTHRSYAAEHGVQDNERLEFLGDSILSAIVCADLYARYPNSDEGRLSKLKSTLVARKTLAEWARKLGLGRHVRMSRGEEATGGRQRESILANCFEAIVGAIYLEAGFEKAQAFVRRRLAGTQVKMEDYKTMLQEKIQRRYQITPTYHVVNQTGPEHNKTFEVEVWVKERRLGRGVGRSKKEAEQAAAAEALERC